MKHSKRILALLLVLALCFGTAPFSALADSVSHDHGEVVSEDDLPESEWEIVPEVRSAGEVVSEPEELTEPAPNTADENTPSEMSPMNASPDAELTEEDLALVQLLETEGAEIAVTKDRTATADTGKRMLKAAAVGQSGTLRIGYNSFSSSVGYLESIKSSVYQLPSKTVMRNGTHVAAYCLEEAKEATQGHGYTSTNLADILGQEKASLIGDILAQGYQYSGSSIIPKANTYKWAITQLMIWQAVAGNIYRDSNTGLNVFKSVVMSDVERCAKVSGHYSDYYAYFYEVKNKLENLRKIPSFAAPKAEIAKNAKRIELGPNADGTSFTKTVSDTNKVLEHFNFTFTGSALSLSKSGNNLTLTSSGEITSAVASQQATHVIKGGGDSVVGWSPASSNQQKFLTCDPQDDPVPAFIAVTTNGELQQDEPVEQQWRVTVTKRDAETGARAQGDASLQNAVYGIYQSGSLLDTYVTNATGSFTTSWYPCGSGYTLREISASTGYLLNTSAVSTGHPGDDSDTELFPLSSVVTEQVIKGRIRLIKHNDQGETGIETPEEGAQFQIYLSSAGDYDNARATERDFLTIDQDGLAVSRDLPYGTYTVHQTKSKDGREKVTDFQVFIAQNGQTYSYILNNRIFEANITIMKKDAETGRTVPASGIGFKIRNQDTGEYVVQHINYPTPQDISVYYTDVTGKLMMPDTLLYGHYELIECSAPFGYVLDPEPVPFIVDGTVKVVEVTRSNIPQKGTINIYKEGEVFFHVDAESPEGPYTPQYSVQGLPGAEFDIFAAADIYTPDGSLKFYSGQKVDTLTTDQYGRDSSIALYLGKYMVVETAAPDGCVLNTAPWLVELSYAGQTVDIMASYFTVTNNRQKVAISLQKVMETDEKFKLGMNDEYKSVRYGLFANEDIRALDGTLIPKDGLIEEVTVSQYGSADFTADLPFGSYYGKEIATDNHYLLPEEKIPFVFSYEGQSKAMVYLYGGWHKNFLKRGTIEGQKVDEDGQSLQGAVMGLFFSDETIFTEETAILTTESDSAGSFAFENVPTGDWLVREIQQPTAFVLNETCYPASISEDGQVVRVEVDNKYIKGNVTVEKIDAEYSGQRLSGAEFQIWKDANENGSFDAEDALIGSLSELEKGFYTMSGLRYGAYFAVETAAPAFYRRDATPHAFEIREDGAEINLIVQNEPQRGSLYIYKTAEDGKTTGIRFVISGTLFTGGSYEEEAETDQNGAILLKNLRVGEYIISEVRDARTARYEGTEDQSVKVEYGEISGVRFYNQLRRNSVYLTKTDPDYPDSKLIGAKFSIYQDNDFSGDYDASVDEYYGDMQADEDLYWLDGLPDGGFFVHEEEAPEGYVPDKEYHYFELDGDTIAQVEITNTPDKTAGFVNRRCTGKLKITKIDADSEKPLEGVNFVVKNKDGEVIAEGTTDSKGLVTFDKLATGSYVYQEIYTLPEYTLDDSEHSFEITKDQQIVEATIKNSKKFTMTLIPKTNDGRVSIWVYVVLLVVAFSALGFFTWRYRREREQDHEK